MIITFWNWTKRTCRSCRTWLNKLYKSQADIYGMIPTIPGEIMKEYYPKEPLDE